MASRGHDKALSKLNVPQMSQKANSVLGECLIVRMEVEKWMEICGTSSSAYFHYRVLIYHLNLTLFASMC